GKHDDGPVEGGPETPGPDLGDNADEQRRDEDGGADDISDLERLGEEVAARLLERGGENLHHPEEGGDLGQLVGGRPSPADLGNGRAAQVPGRAAHDLSFCSSSGSREGALSPPVRRARDESPQTSPEGLNER